MGGFFGAVGDNIARSLGEREREREMYECITLL